MPEISTLTKAAFESTSDDAESLTSLTTKTITSTTASAINAANDIAIVIKKALNALRSFCLYATTIEKYMIERYIKNSTIIKNTISVIDNPSENSPTTIVEMSIVKIFLKSGDANIITSEITKTAKLATISISAVKNFEFAI